MAILLVTYLIQPSYGAAQLQGLAIGALPLAMAAVAQAIVVISGGIDLSIGSMMALTSVTAAVLMKDQPEAFASPSSIGVLVLGLILGHHQRRARGHHARPRHRRHAGDVVRVGRCRAARPAHAGRRRRRTGSGARDGLDRQRMDPERAGHAAGHRRRRLDPAAPLDGSASSLYAVGSDRLAAFRSGVPVGRTKVFAYMLGGLFSAFGGLALTATTGIGTPVPGAYTLLSVAAIVLGGVSLAGGRGGIAGPIVAVFVLALVRTDLTFLGANPNLSTVIQGAILIGVVMFGSLLTMRRARA